MGKEFFEKVLALFWREFGNPRGHPLRDVQERAAGPGVHLGDRRRRGWRVVTHGLRELAGELSLTSLVNELGTGHVYGVQIFDSRTEFMGEGVPGVGRVDK